MCVLKDYGEVVPREGHMPLQVAESHSPVELNKREIHNNLIKRTWGDSVTPARTYVKADEDVLVECEDNDKEHRTMFNLGI